MSHGSLMYYYPSSWVFEHLQLIIMFEILKGVALLKGCVIEGVIYHPSLFAFGLLLVLQNVSPQHPAPAFMSLFYHPEL